MISNEMKACSPFSYCSCSSVFFFLLLGSFCSNAGMAGLEPRMAQMTCNHGKMASTSVKCFFLGFVVSVRFCSDRLLQFFLAQFFSTSRFILVYRHAFYFNRFQPIKCSPCHVIAAAYPCKQLQDSNSVLFLCSLLMLIVIAMSSRIQASACQCFGSVVLAQQYV